MNIYEMRFPGYDASANLGLIRWELFLHRDVKDVLPAPRADTLLVVCRGEPDPVAWGQTLTAAGFPPPRLMATEGESPGAAA